mgnify:CR=1 FL=1
MPDYKVNIRAELENFEKIEKIQSQLQSLEKNPINVKVQLSGLDGSDLSKFTKQLENIGQKLGTSVSNGIKSGISGTKVSSNLSQKVQSLFDTKTIDARLSSFNSTLNKFSPNTAEYERAAQSLQSLRNAYQDLKTAKDNFDTSATDDNFAILESSYKKLNTILKQTQSEMRILSNEQSKLISSSTKASMIKSFESYFEQNSKAAKKYADDISILRQQLESLATTADKVDFDTKFNNLKATINRNGDTGKSAWDELKRGFGQIAEFTGVYGVTSRIQDALMSMPSIVVEVDDAMTDLQMATGATDEQAQQLMSTYSEMGKVLKATATDISASATEWMKQGQSIADSQTLAEYSIILSKIGDLSSTDATKTITAAMKSYDLNIDEVMGFIDQISSIDIASATDVGGLSQAFNEVAANARQAGVETQQLLAYAAAIGETTQEGMASVGTSLNSIFSRMGNIKLARLKDYENNGEDLSNVETVLRGVGISLRDSINEFRDFDEVLDETASRWKSFSGVQQRAVAQAFAGTHHMNDFMVLMQQWDKVEEYIATADGASGEAMAKYEEYQDSLSGKLEGLKNQFQETSTTILNSDFLGGLIETGTGVLNIVTQLIDKLGILGTLFTVGGGIAGAKGHGLNHSIQAPFYKVA